MSVCLSDYCQVCSKIKKWKQYQLTVEATSWDTLCFLFSMSATHFFRRLNTLCSSLSVVVTVHHRLSWSLDSNVIFPCVSSVLLGEHQASEPGSVPSIHQQHAVFMWRRFQWRHEVPEERGVDELTVRLPHGKELLRTSMKCHLQKAFY